MKKSDINPAKGVQWDLGILYKSIDDPQIEIDKKNLTVSTAKFVKKYKSNISSGQLNPESLLTALQEYENLLNSLYIYQTYTGLMQAKDTISDKINHFYSKSEEFANEIANQLIFFDLEILEIPELLFSNYLSTKILANYKQYLLRIHKFKKHTLKEDQEILLSKKSQTSGSAFVRLYDQISSDTTYQVVIDNEEHDYSYSEITNILSTHPERRVREAAASALTKVYTRDSRTYSFILNTLLLDKKVSDEIRKYDYPQQATLMSDEIDLKTVQTMTKVIENNYNISEEFYVAKSKIVGESLHEWDRYSLLYPEIEEPTFSYDQAKAMILESFAEFSPTFATTAQKFFDNNWIDAELSKGKKSGAFCSYTVPSKNPFILTNFTGKANDVRTLAHELGHSIHGYLSREQTLLNFWPVTPFAEIASIFCENIVFRKIYSETNDRKQKANLLSGRLQEIFATIFRQNAFYLFESDIHDHRRKDGELSVSRINELFQKRMQPMFGKGLNLTDGHQYWWIPVAHFFHYNFYVFSYAFGQTLSNALYGLYLNDGNNFVENYIKVLKMGSSKELNELTKILKVDIHHPEFWDLGIEPVAELVKEFKKLVD
jgi:oligoendopeptidase F